MARNFGAPTHQLRVVQAHRAAVSTKPQSAARLMSIWPDPHAGGWLTGHGAAWWSWTRSPAITWKRPTRYRAELGLVDEAAQRLAAEAADHFQEAGRRAMDRGDTGFVRQGVELSPLQMWVLPDGLPACRGPTIACMGSFDDVPPPGSAPPRVRAGRASAVPVRRRRRTALVRLPVVDAAGRDFVPACGLSAVPSWPAHSDPESGGQQATAKGGTVMTEGATQTAAGSGAAIAVVRAPAELDLATADGLAARGCAIAGHAGLLLLDLTSLSFCDARGLSAFVRIANQADRAGCRLALIAPQPPVAKVLRICRLDQRLPVFATTGHALADLTAVPAPA